MFCHVPETMAIVTKEYHLHAHISALLQVWS